VNPFDYFGSIRCVNLDDDTERWQEMQARFRILGIADRVERTEAVRTRFNYHVGCALSHRRGIQDAADRGCSSVLLLEDDALFLDRTLAVLAGAVEELARIDWTICFLGGTRWEREDEPVPGCRWLYKTGRRTSCHATAIHRQVFPFALQELPATIPGMTEWVKDKKAIDQYEMVFPRDILDRAVTLCPAVVTQPILLPYEDSHNQFHFTI
jgi:hypothetical protein